jgi:hypothetical protein
MRRQWNVKETQGIMKEMGRRVKNILKSPGIHGTWHETQGDAIE